MTGAKPPKTLEDFPKFVATGMRRGAKTAAGYTSFEVEGHLDPSIKIEGLQWFWLLFGKRGTLCASVQSLDNDTRVAVLTFEAQEEPDIVGHSLAYLSPYWQAYNVWMVLDPDLRWQKKAFLGMDALAEDFQSKDTSFIDGREVKFWTKLSPPKEKGGIRYYPDTDQSSTSACKSRVVPLGWDHEHCELCNSHIDIGMFGYCDPEDCWVCESCYARYVVPHDLAFVYEL